MDANLETTAASFYPEEGKDSLYADHGLIQRQAFINGAEWMAKRTFTKEQLFLFAGYCMGKRMLDPTRDVSEILEEWKEDFKNQSI